MLPQPGGLPEGSRGSARRARTPGTRERVVSTLEGCQNPHASTPKNDQLSVLLRKQCGGFLVGLGCSTMRRLCHPSGVKSFFSWRTGGRSSALRPPATFWQPSGLRRPTKLQETPSGALTPINSNGSGAGVRAGVAFSEDGRLLTGHSSLLIALRPFDSVHWLVSVTSCHAMGPRTSKSPVINHQSSIINVRPLGYVTSGIVLSTASISAG